MQVSDLRSRTSTTDGARPRRREKHLTVRLARRAPSTRSATLVEDKSESYTVTRLINQFSKPDRNVKHEDVYLNGYATMGDLTVGLMCYFAFYNEERPHQSLNYQTPDVVYASGAGGGAMIVDKYGSAAVTPLITLGTVTGMELRPKPCPAGSRMRSILPLREWEIKQARTALCSFKQQYDHSLNSGTNYINGGFHFSGIKVKIGRLASPRAISYFINFGEDNATY